MDLFFRKKTQVKINSVIYTCNLLVSATCILNPWSAQSISTLEIDHLTTAIDEKTEVIIIGHKQLGQFLPPTTLQALAQHRIGIECMSIGAASRTYNVLLSERRRVTLGLLF